MSKQTSRKKVDNFEYNRLLLRNEEKVKEIKQGTFQRSTKYIEKVWRGFENPTDEQKATRAEQIKNCFEEEAKYILHETPSIRDFYTFDKGKIGDGGFGYVKKCWRKTDRALFAVKICDKTTAEMLQDKKLSFHSFRTECELLYFSRDHPSIVNMEEVFENETYIYFVMEYLAGGTLSDRLSEERSILEEMEQERTVPLVLKHRFQDMVTSICFLHAQGIIHCDIKPENFVFEDESFESRLKLIDFGFAQVYNWDTKLTEACGTPHYMAPEVPKKNYNAAADVWSLGVCLYDMVFKFNPFYTKADMTVRDIITSVQRGFKAKVKPGYGPWFPASEPYDENTRDLIGKMLTKKVSNRPAAEEILEHPWFSSLRLENALSPAVIKSILSFGIMNPLQKLILATMLRSGILTKEEILATKDTFDLIDIDGDGNVTIEEFASAIKKLQGTEANIDEIEKLFDAIDIDQSRTLSLKEFLVARAHRKVCLRPDRLKKIFALYDPDSDMSISPDEMKTVLDANGIILERKQIVMFMKTVDADGDGELSWQEFVAMFHADADKH